MFVLPGTAGATATTAQDQQDGLTLQPVISQTGTFDSNPLLLLHNVQELYGSVTTPELILSDITPTKKLNLDTQVNENIYNLSEFDSTDLHSKGNLTTQNPNWSAGISEQIDYDTTRTSEPSNFGFTTQPVRHLGLLATPQITYSPLATEKLGLSATAQTSQYATSAFTDYEQFSVTPSYTHTFDPLNAGLFQFLAQEYKATQGPKNITDTVGPSIGWIATLTPRLALNATIGGQLTKQDQAGTPPTPWQANYDFSTDLTFKGEQDKTDVTATRSQYPFGNGADALLTSFSATDSHLLNKKLSLNIGINYEYADYPSVSTGNLQSLASTKDGLTYHVTDHVDITGTYQYRYETLVGVSKSVDDHSVNIGLAYHPKAWTF